MFQYEYEKRPPSAGSCDSRATMTTDWSRVYPNSSRAQPNVARTYPTPASIERARRPLPPRPIVCETLPTKTTVPLKVWVIASASCFAVCAALVLATVVITKWGTSDNYARRELYEVPEPVYSPPFPPTKTQKPSTPTTTEPDASTSSDELVNDIKFPILEKLSIFKNIVANRDKKRTENKKQDSNLNLVSKPQLHPVHDTSIQHEERKIEKKDQAVYPINLNAEESKAVNNKLVIPTFKPTLPEMVLNRKDIKIIDITGYKKVGLEYDDYYNDENLYDDYMESNTMTSYLIEKVQELHDWFVSDPDFNMNNVTKKENSGNDFGQLLTALNESLIEGNVTIIMNKLKDIYFGENYTHANHTRKVILSNSTDLLSFGILTLDVMLLHNIQLMAWENQESARTKMMKDPDVFAFNALFLEPTKVGARQNELQHLDGNTVPKRPPVRTDGVDDFDVGKALLDNVLEIGMSTARAAIHLGRAYKNTKVVLNQLSNRETLNANIQNQISRNIDANTHALQHLQNSFSNSSAANTTVFYTELDCVWLLYCKNLMATSKLNPPYGTMARINGMALRMLTGELSADRALDTMLYEALTGWTDLRCADMFPRCSKVDAATVVMESILTPVRKSQSSTRV
ncbi:uncharacterized protein LOC126379438 [Pectinophora gossypiella]|uniref:uncharacterized protein LOC126379438 n=1 Tax=Pectinophora gossypiella TaxID=13191 RepID=UPI00214E1A8E|nr:uncharacterized protein LOC126379438 [Pectinophora gossypiella]